MDPLLLCGSHSLIAGVALLPFLRVKKLGLSSWLLIYLFSYCGLCTSLIWFFLAEALRTGKLSRRELAPVLIILAGILLFMASGFQGGSLKGFLGSATEGIVFALMTVSSKKCCGENPLGLTALANPFTAAFLFLFLPPAPTDMLNFTETEWTVLLILGIVQIGIGYSLYNMGLKQVRPKASVLALWEMILARSGSLCFWENTRPLWSLPVSSPS